MERLFLVVTGPEGGKRKERKEAEEVAAEVVEEAPEEAPASASSLVSQSKAPGNRRKSVLCPCQLDLLIRVKPLSSSRHLA